MAKKNHRSSLEAQTAILDAAEQIMVKVGPAGLRISAVAKAAHMAHPNIIHHFGSREGLMTALAERVGFRATERITAAISEALNAIEQDQTQLIAAMTKVLDTAYQGDEGRAAVWLHLGGIDCSLKENMRQIVELSHQLRQSLDPSVELKNTSRLVMLVTLALVGEVVAGAGIESAMGFAEQGQGQAHFSQWLAEVLLNLSDQDLQTSLG